MEYDKRKYPMKWERPSTRGYRFTALIPCRVTGTSAKRIRIAALMVDGSDRYLTVPLERLVHDPCECFNACRVMRELKEKVS